jgi:hypothetical protein
MSNACRCVLTLVICGLLLTAFSLVAQEPAPASSATPALEKSPLTVALILTPEFCSTVNNKGHLRFLIGKTACNQLEPALKGVFTSLQRVGDSSQASNARVVLEPKFTDVSVTDRAFTFSKTDLVVVVEWTARDQSGKTLWVETAQGAASRGMGNNLTLRKNMDRLLREAVDQMVSQSVSKISSARQLLQAGAQAAK